MSNIVHNELRGICNTHFAHSHSQPHTVRCIVGPIEVTLHEPNPDLKAPCSFGDEMRCRAGRQIGDAVTLNHGETFNVPAWKWHMVKAKADGAAWDCDFGNGVIDSYLCEKVPA